MKKNFDNDADLIVGLIKGRESAYTYLVETYNHKLCSYANSLLNDIPVSEDMVQNVFIKIWERRRLLRTDISLKGYLYKSVYNSCINQYKKDQAVTTLEKKYIEGLNSVVFNKNEDSYEELKTRVERAIHELPPKCKEIFLLSKKEGLTNIEIADYLKISKKTIERQITIAFTKIKKNVRTDKSDMILYLLFGKTKKY